MLFIADFFKFFVSGFGCLWLVFWFDGFALVLVWLVSSLFVSIMMFVVWFARVCFYDLLLHDPYVLFLTFGLYCRVCIVVDVVRVR